MEKTADGKRQTVAGDSSDKVRRGFLPSAVCRLPSVMGSILFHTILLLLVLLWFSLSPGTDRGAPGVRNAAGMIVAQSGGGGEQTADGRQQIAAEAEMVELERFANINLSAMPVTPIIAPGPNQNVDQFGGASAGELAASLQRAGLGTGTGIGVGAGTGDATIAVFGTEGTGTKFMYVFDRSTSMEGTPLRAAKRELIRSVYSLEEHHQFNVIFYSSKDYWQLWQPPERGRRLVNATAANKQGAERHINSITAFGSTEHYGPLLEAIRHRPDVIFFLTDGESYDDLTSVQLRDIERENSRFGQGVQINVIQFGRGGFTDSPSQSLQQLASDNHGQYRYENVLRLR
ncbi:MAG: VWA domain-containing protein [Planctomycetaceae bacterium]|nr:VWA domain-containing protein [Planctomycetaceae bacterium]